MEKRDLHKIIIVGAGFAGLQAAKGLTAPLFDVTIIDKHNYHLFQPLLYQVATAGLSPADIALPIRNIFRSQKNLKVILDELIGIDPLSNKITTKNNSYLYDFLILATGSEPSYFEHGQWKNFATSLKNCPRHKSRKSITICFPSFPCFPFSFPCFSFLFSFHQYLCSTLFILTVTQCVRVNVRT